MYLWVPWPLPTMRPVSSSTSQSAKKTELPPPLRRARATRRWPSVAVPMKLQVSDSVKARRGVAPFGVLQPQ